MMRQEVISTEEQTQILTVSEHLSPTPQTLIAHIDADRFEALQCWANQVAALLGGEAYLVGSCLNPENTEPRDWDIRLLLSNEFFAMRYFLREYRKDKSVGKLYAFIDRWQSERDHGMYTVNYWRWADEMVRLSNQGRMHTGCNVDCQVYPYRWWECFGPANKRVRLDTRGKNYSTTAPVYFEESHEERVR